MSNAAVGVWQVGVRGLDSAWAMLDAEVDGDGVLAMSFRVMA